MKKPIVTLSIMILACLTAVCGYSQVTPDTEISGEGNNIVIHPVYHGTLAIEWKDITFYVDPHGEAWRFSKIKAPDLIFITDIHRDHLDPETLSGLDTDNATFVVPQAVADQLPETYKSKMTVLGNGEEDTISGIPVKALPMYNIPQNEDPLHVKGRGNGYVITLDDKRIYVSGDTEDIPEMRALEDIDIAFICMNLPYTMTVEQAADAVLDFKPKVVYPYHYQGNPDVSDIKKFKKLVKAGDRSIEVRLRNWYK
ncbi:MBL fold metallo-hydrolase [Sinomicrobium weinanense]|uniref:MBL fold metallo-hydrolase n=1 Tax=Sinomicrobium weinanense TaxID=2842200 RepID=A0A926Q1T1_9FLAO|nr:MBL fold metallo-hydrolase [Sinomicrobium weinanense]MBC9795997.1 MBL fold metallo-hydrolase [Sinomicrobium weinanense]MBU3122116.1 MBL fold metallo-hydrolase [Sinomicrobium weinanense]